MCIKTKYYKMDQVPKEQKEYFESLIGHTPFSFFQNFINFFHNHLKCKWIKLTE